MNFKKRKGLSLGAAPGAILMLVLIAITAIVGQKVLTQLNVGQAAGTAINQSVANASAGIAEVTSQLTLIGLILVMSIVIGVLFSSFNFGGGGGV
jgi:hypothetical protein